MVSYARVLYERVLKITLLRNQHVVAWGGGHVPTFEQLIVVPNGASNEVRLLARMNR